tara:strand:+ start:271 stop:660 length:390 start_codon:yes stop_codon:yes gene_type:complete
MEGFLARRRSDPRFHRGTAVPDHSSTAVGDWYRKTEAVHTERFTFSAAGGYETSPKKSDPDNSEKKKKKKKRKSGEAFTEGEKKKLTNRESSDDSDGGPCWSDYERVPGTKAGERGSCKPKGSKKKSDD